jgi:hypothetical protein
MDDSIQTRPRRFSQPELDKFGVTIEKRHQNILLSCESCGCRWSPNLISGGRLPRGYWKCPNRCNISGASRN